MSERERLELDMEIRRLRERRRRRKVWGKRFLTLSAAWVFAFGLFGISVVQGQSMRPAYKAGDVVCFLRVLPGGVKYGDVVIVNNDIGVDCIKRIVGLPGDVLEIDTAGRLIRNGMPVSERDVIYGAESGEEGGFTTFTVPEDSYFYLGDNRPQSRDSRQTGCAARKQIRGKVILTLRK